MIVTSNESATSIETQFNSLAAELKHRTGCLNLMLDEKKCESLKSVIEHIHVKLS